MKIGVVDFHLSDYSDHDAIDYNLHWWLVLPSCQNCAQGRIEVAYDKNQNWDHIEISDWSHVLNVRMGKFTCAIQLPRRQHVFDLVGEAIQKIKVFR